MYIIDLIFDSTKVEQNIWIEWCKIILPPIIAVAGIFVTSIFAIKKFRVENKAEMQKTTKWRDKLSELARKDIFTYQDVLELKASLSPFDYGSYRFIKKDKIKYWLFIRPKVNMMKNVDYTHHLLINYLKDINKNEMDIANEECLDRYNKSIICTPIRTIFKNELDVLNIRYLDRCDKLRLCAQIILNIDWTISVNSRNYRRWGKSKKIWNLAKKTKEEFTK